MKRYDTITEIRKRYEEITEVRKFNHHHDSLGRFSSGGGGGAAAPVSFSTTSHEKFNEAISAARESRPAADKWRVDVHSAEDYRKKGCKCFVSEGGSTVAVTSDGDIISVCKAANETTRGVGAKLLEQAVENGGTKLDSFAGNHKFYTANGFEPVSWTPFNEEYAPPGWAESGSSPEPVVFYKYVGKGNVKGTDINAFLQRTKPFTGDDGYDDAMRYRDSQIGGTK